MMNRLRAFMPSTAVLVPILLILSSTMMAFAWIGHLKWSDTWSFWTALGVSWAIVLPEYILNVSATRMGEGIYTGAQMASIHLCSGVVCVALVSRFFLQEPMSLRQMLGFGLMCLSIVLITGGSNSGQ